MTGISIKKAFFSAALIVLFLPLYVCANDEEFLLCDLSLAGYSIGMTYEQAARVRPFDYLENLESPQIDYRYYVAIINKVYLADEEMELTIYFQNDRLQKVLARFNPVSMDDMVAFFRQKIGPCENSSGTVNWPNGEEIQKYVYKWNFPKAKLVLAGFSTNPEFATASLIAEPGVLAGEMGEL